MGILTLLSLLLIKDIGSRRQGPGQLIGGGGPGGPIDLPCQAPGEDRRDLGGRTFAAGATAAVAVHPVEALREQRLSRLLAQTVCEIDCP
jgi:hypothetical protein